ncbi:MAG: hypothetical protein NTY02_20380 [Acidobacteria bacterium]|nr:hypothetical protein [Acidobacteriota bacterium]
MADPDWKVIADAIAAKFGSMAGIREATADPDGAPPLMVPAAVVFPPGFEITEDLSADVYTARFPVAIVLDGSQDLIRAAAVAWSLQNKIVPAWHSGRLLGLSTIVQNSYVAAVAFGEIVQWGEPTLPGLNIEIVVDVRVPAQRTA